MAGEPKINEPLAVKAASHLLQNPNAPQVVLNQFVIGGKDAGDSALGGKRGELEFVIENLPTTYVRNIYAGRNWPYVVFEARASDNKPQEVLVEIVTFRSQPSAPLNQ